MSTLWRRALAVTTIALVAGAGITACSPADTATTAKSAGSQSQPEETPQAAGPMTAADFAQRMNDAQYEAGSAHFTQVMEVAGKRIETVGDVVLVDDPSRMKMSMTMPGSMELRLIDGETYLNLGQLTGGKFFTRSKDSSSPLFAQLGTALEQVDLGKQLAVFEAALKDFTADEGAETIDGVKTTKYTLTLDTKELLAAQGAAAPGEALAQLGDTVTYDLYAGPDDLPRRLVMDAAGTAVTMEFSKWGEPADIVAPAPDQITDQAPPGF